MASSKDFHRLPPVLREQIASYPRGPVVQLDHRADDKHARLLASLIDAVDGAGLPRVAGFTFDPADVGAVLDGRMSPRPIAFHPRLGALLGSHTCVLAAPVYEWEHLDRALRFEAGTSVGDSWQQALVWLLDLDRARRRRWALWLSLGPPAPADPFNHERELRGRFKPLEWMFRGARTAMVAELAEGLALKDGGNGRFRDGEANVLWLLGAELLLCTDDTALLDRALRWASAHRVPILPDSLSMQLPWSDRLAPPSPSAPYAVSLPFWQRKTGLHVEREAGDDAPSVFAFSQDGTVNIRRAIAPRTIARGGWAGFDGATPCLRRYLGRRGIQRDPALRDVSAVERFVAREAKGWECLVDAEEVLGGLDLRPPEVVHGPDLLGVFAMLAMREELERLGVGDLEPDDGAAPPPKLPWPFFVCQGHELAVIGRIRERCDVWICVDREGVFYRMVTEFDRLSAEASNPRALLETWAFQDAQFMPLDGLGRKPVLAIDAAVDDSLLAGFELETVGEASDRLGRWDLGDGLLVRRRFGSPLDRAVTILYAAGPATAIALARRVRAALPETRMHVHGGTRPVDEVRVAAFRDSDLLDVLVREWDGFGNF